MDLKKYIGALFLILSFFRLGAQETGWTNDNFRQDSIVVSSDTLKLNANLILPEKFKITDENGNEISDLFYKIDYSTAEIIFDSSLNSQKVIISYFVHPDFKQQTVFSKDTAIIREPVAENRYYTLSREKREAKKPFDGLNSRGSLVRGIRFGNNQSASVQSSLDLQLTGQLTNEIGINAVISDNNVPIQADGYTQQLQEFDKIYVEIFNKNSKIKAGHVDLIQENDFFGNFTQKVTGVEISTELTHSNDSKTRISLAGSTTRGEFASKKITGQNGNQGPYRLSGNNNELYIIIVSGSEKVYLDGILLTRGEDRDYVINYNTGELSFTSNRLITDNSRITVEYLYANRAYTQFLAYGGIEHESERFRIAGHFYSNGDSKNNPLTDNLSDEDIQILSEAGNNPDEMYNTTAVRSDYDPEKNLYRKIQISGVEVFEFSDDPNEELWQVSFTYMGDGKGNYVASNVEVNGKIFEYVPPIDGLMQGNYEPVRQLIPPKRLQVYTLNSAYKFKTGGVIGIDLGMSNQDLNLFSSKDDDKNIGLATRIYGNKDFELKNWKLQPQMEFSFIQKNFNSIQRLRPVEFDRDFNLENELSDSDQAYLRLGLESSFKDSLKLKYDLHYLQNKDFYDGIKNDLSLNYLTKKNFAEAGFSILNNRKQNLVNPEMKADQSRFVRYNATVKRKIKNSFWLGAGLGGEDNEIEDRQNSTDGNHLSDQSFRWNEIRGMAGIGDTAKIYAELTYYNRKDDSVRLGVMQRLTRSNGWILNSKLISRTNHRFETSFHYRTVKYIFEDNPDEDFITGNIKWYKSLLRNGMTVNLFYELGSGMEPQREFEYVKVTDGMGIYKWIDYNGDGLEQLDEFEIAEYQDEANYIRVYTNTINYLKTNKNNLNLSVRIKPRELLNSKNEFLGRWMLQGSLQSANSLFKNGRTLEWNPFVKSDELLNKSRSLKSILNFNQGGKYKWSAAYTYSSQESQNFLFTGAESRDTKSHLVNAKYRPWQHFNILTEAENIRTSSHSDLFSSRRFKLDAWRLKPGISYQIESKFSAALNYTFQTKKNTDGIEKLKQSDLGAEIQWNDGSKSSLLGTFNYIKNDFTGNGQSVVGNQMMEGLKSGNNLVWQFTFQRQLNSFLSVNISYDGRKTEGNKSIHSGSVQIQARF